MFRLEIRTNQLHHPVRALANGTLTCNCLDMLLGLVNIGVFIKYSNDNCIAMSIIVTCQLPGIDLDHYSRTSLK